MAEIRKTNIFQYLKTKYNNVASIVKMNGTQSAGSSDYIARADHVHPTDTSRAASNHSHGSLINDGALNSDITSVNKVAVTDATNKLKTISKLPLDKVTHQDISGKANVNHSHDSASSSANGFLSKEDKSKLDGIATEANKTVVDSSLSSSSTNPVQNKVVNSALNGKSNTGHEHTSDEIHYAYDQNVSVTTILENKAPKHHTHDDRYYTEAEIDEKLNGKADSNHRHNDVSILKQVDNDWVGLPVWYMIKNGWCILQWENPISYLASNNISIPNNSWFKLGNVPVPQTGRAVYQQLTTSNTHIRIQITSGGVLQSYSTGNNVWSYGTLVYPTKDTS